jgi:hypothetical protein
LPYLCNRTSARMMLLYTATVVRVVATNLFQLTVSSGRSGVMKQT